MTGTKKNAWDELSLHKHGYIEASAGTGKTFTIENLVVRILIDPQSNPWKRWIDIEELLVVTYTEKAAEELRYRIRHTLEETLRKRASLDADAVAHIDRCLTRFDRAAIYTFHGFCNRFLTSHAFESHSTFGADAKQTDASQLALRVVRDSIRSTLMAAQWADCEKMQASCARWDCDGVDDFCKKATSVLQQYDPNRHDALRPGPQPDTIVSMYNQIRAAFGTDDPNNHPFAQSWSCLKSALNLKTAPRGKKELLLKAIISAPKLDTAGDVVAFFQAEPIGSAFIKKCPSSLFIPVEDEESSNYRSFAEVASVIADFKGKSFTDFINSLDGLHKALTQHAAAENLKDFFSILCDAREKLSRLKHENGVLTFDDMIVYMHTVLSGKDRQLLSVLRKRFRYGIIDEFQDTNMLQWDIFKRIFVDENDTRPDNLKSSLYVVGDPKQSVFSFQGSDVNVYLKATEELKKAGATEALLTTNYRSSQAMVKACNSLFLDGCDSDSDDDWFMYESSKIRYSAVHSCGDVADIERDEGVPEELQRPVVFRALYSVNKEGLETRRKADKERVLAQWICSLTAYLTRCENGRTPIRIPLEKETAAQSNPAYRNLELSDICILVEKHRDAGPVMRLFREKGISYTKQRNTGLFASDECLHLLVMLDAIDRLDNNVAVKKALLTKFFNVSPSRFGETPDVYGEFFRDEVEKVRHCAVLAQRRQWGMLFGELFRATALFDSLKKDPERKLRIAALRQLRNYCCRRLIDDHLTLESLVGCLRSLFKGETREAEAEDIFHKETEGNAVRILTMFSAKGLEFPVVFIASGKGTEKKTVDYYPVRNDNGGTDFWFDKKQGKVLFKRLHTQETRRLYYVALTRAKYRLFAPVWDAYDADAGGIVQAGKSGDRSSASSLFLSRICHAASARVENSALLSLVNDNFTVPAGGEPPTVEKAEEPVAGRWLAQDGTSPAKRMTVQLSYSGMVRLARNLGIRANPGADEPIDSEKDREARQKEVLAPSAKTGNALHDILEQADFASWAQAGSAADLLAAGSHSAQLIERSLAGRGLLPGTQKDALVREAAAALVRNSLFAAIPDPAGDGTITLGAIPGPQRKTEAEFTFTFAKDGGPFPPEGEAIGGWVLGFMDLLFRHQGRYYLLDWKSNWLPDNNYEKEAIGKNIELHRYDVQYKVYSLALHNWLRNRMKEYDPQKHFGGVLYVYLRGTKPGLNSGIWTGRPLLGQLQTEWPAELANRVAGIGREQA
jgi:exodeoxyribonuclease V beta subunit